MKPKLYTFILTGLIAFFSFSCKTASKLYQKGNYDEAVELAAKKLQKDPNDAKLLDIIQNSYHYAVTDHESKIRSDAESSNELKWEWMYNEYASLQSLYDAIYRVPQVYTLINPANYSSYLVTYSEKAGDVRFDRGLSQMQHSDKQSFKNAYREFQAALVYKPGNRDIQQKLNEAYDYAVTNVVVLPVQQNDGYQFGAYNSSNLNFEDQLLRNLKYNSGNEFVKYYSSGDARSSNIRVDQVVDMRMATLNIGHYYDNRSTRRVSKEVVIKEIVYRPDSVVKEYGKIYADITTTRRTMNSNALLQVTIEDENGSRLWSDNFTSSHNWSTEFATYTGDARALSETDLQIINRRPENGPNKNEIISCMMDEISNNALYSVKNYFNRF